MQRRKGWRCAEAAARKAGRGRSREGIMEYTVLIHQAEEGGYWSEVPALPGCYSQGETIDETLINSREAIEAHLTALKEEELQEDLHDLSVIATRKDEKCISLEEMKRRL
jgi:predicted RNase H-like HicB family nuclease